MKKRVIVALGGNAILNKGEEGTFEVQYENVYRTMEHIAKLLELGYEVVVTHGNGPQVGAVLIQNDAGKDQVPIMPMFVAGAMTQGQIGLFIQQSLNNIFTKNNVKASVVTVVTQVEVDANDPSFTNPTKPVGPFYTKEEAEAISNENGYIIKEDAGRGYRRVVPSPQPINIIEIEAIKDLIESDNIVIASGGGGIPVVREGVVLVGKDAVIDKDKSASLMGDKLDADYLIILTAVSKVALDFGKEDETQLDEMTIKEGEQYLKEGHFAPGSMKPKIEACLEFVGQDSSRKALITSPNKLLEALDGKAGTWIVS